MPFTSRYVTCPTTDCPTSPGLATGSIHSTIVTCFTCKTRICLLCQRPEHTKLPSNECYRVPRGYLTSSTIANEWWEDLEAYKELKDLKGMAGTVELKNLRREVGEGYSRVMGEVERMGFLEVPGVNADAGAGGEGTRVVRVLEESGTGWNEVNILVGGSAGMVGSEGVSGDIAQPKPPVVVGAQSGASGPPRALVGSTAPRTNESIVQPQEPAVRAKAPTRIPRPLHRAPAPVVHPGADLRGLFIEWMDAQYQQPQGPGN